MFTTSNIIRQSDIEAMTSCLKHIESVADNFDPDCVTEFDIIHNPEYCVFFDDHRKIRIPTDVELFEKRVANLTIGAKESGISKDVLDEAAKAIKRPVQHIIDHIWNEG